MPRKVVYIMSLAHSGSTLMELLINAHFRDVTSLGEVHPTFSRRSEVQKVCTCGKDRTECSLWRHVDFHGTGDFKSFYADVLASVPTDYATDSSKSLKIFREFHLEDKDRFIVIFLRKGLISYLQSSERRGRRERGALRRMIKYNPVRIVLGWLFHNFRMFSFLRGAGVAHMNATYEDLCNHTGPMMQKLSDLAGMELKHDRRIDGAHLLRGNRMRYDFVHEPVVRPYDEAAGQTLSYRLLARMDRAFNRYLTTRCKLEKENR